MSHVTTHLSARLANAGQKLFLLLCLQPDNKIKKHFICVELPPLIKLPIFLFIFIFLIKRKLAHSFFWSLFQCQASPHWFLTERKNAFWLERRTMLKMSPCVLVNMESAGPAVRGGATVDDNQNVYTNAGNHSEKTVLTKQMTLCV